MVPPAVSITAFLVALRAAKSYGAMRKAAAPTPATLSDLAQALREGRVARIEVGPGFWDVQLKQGAAGAAAAAGAATGRSTRHAAAAAVTAAAAAVLRVTVAPAALELLGPSISRLLARSAGRSVQVAPRPAGWSNVLATLALIALPVCYAGLLYFVVQRLQNPRGEVGKRSHIRRSARVSFDDVAGIDDAREQVMELVKFLRDPTPYVAVGARIPKGVLLHGPPGTGKTLLARAVAGEAGVPFLSCAASDFVEMLVGRGASRVRDLFRRARASAPCIVFIDELDALGKARGGLNSHDEREQTLNALLTEMDGFDNATGKPVVVIGATNRAEILDAALMRGGRFDRLVRVPTPDAAGRAAILAVHLRRVRQAPDVSLDEVAAVTKGLSGADLSNMVNEAALLTVRRGRDVVTHECLMQAARDAAEARAEFRA